MLDVHFPEPDFRIQTKEGRKYLFDPLRKKWLLLTGEEWVRQNFVRYLTEVAGYPSTLVALEKQIQVGERVKRFDILVYDQHHQPWLLVECKQMTVELGEDVLQQALRYHIAVPVKYILITNGRQTFAWEKKDGRLAPLSSLPDWKGGRSS